MKKKYILSLDQGTSSSRAIIFDDKTNIISKDQHELKQYYPKPGWVEQDPNEICQTQFTAIFNVIKKAKISFKDIASIGITNQRETTILWDKKTGIPVHNAIVWQDKRTSEYCQRLINKGYLDTIKKKTGLVIDAYFSASKIRWILENIPEIKSKAKKGEVLFGTVDTWLIWNLTNKKLHITDVSNASRTMLFNINTLKWDEELLSLFNIPKAILPEVKSSSEIYGKTDKKIFDNEILISGIAGDQQAALFGQHCFDKGMAKNTYGTGCFILMNTGEKPVFSKNGLISTIAWQINGKTIYALEGSVFIAGAAVKWLRDALKIIKNASETESIATSLNDSGQIFVIPAFSGLGAPYWNQKTRGAILGITQGTTDKHITRATLESIAYQSCDVIKAMESDSKIILKELKVDGGASANNFLMQFQANLLQKRVIRPESIESTALGAALLSGLSTGVWNIEELYSILKPTTIFNRKMSNKEASDLYKNWQIAIDKIL